MKATPVGHLLRVGSAARRLQPGSPVARRRRAAFPGEFAINLERMSVGRRPRSAARLQLLKVRQHTPVRNAFDHQIEGRQSLACTTDSLQED